MTKDISEAAEDFLRLEDDWLWLCSVPELDWKQKMVLLHYFGSPKSIRQADKEEFHDWEKLGIDWVKRLYPCMNEDFPDQVREQMKRQQVSFVSRDHPAYPKRLRAIPDSPYGLFYKGRLPATAPMYVGIVGARACSSYGRAVARQIAGALGQNGIHVVSGMAMGIDGIAQNAAVESGGTSFAVLGCGAERCYPRMNIDLYMSIQERGGILSEYPCGSTALSWHFPAHNRIISGLCDILVVIEAGKKSGSLITARQALIQGREVYALPGRINDPLSEGCNELISDGAGVILSADRFIDMILDQRNTLFGKPEQLPAEKEKDGNPGANLTGDEALIYRKLGLMPVTREKLKEETGLTMAQIQNALLRLQLADLASEVAKNQFVKQR